MYESGPFDLYLIISYCPNTAEGCDEAKQTQGINKVCYCLYTRQYQQGQQPIGKKSRN